RSRARSRGSGTTAMPATEGPVLIVTAFREEFAAVLARARDPRSRGDHVRARIGNTAVAVAMTGDGPCSAGSRASALCETLRPSALLRAGVAGALSPDLRGGEMLVSRRVADSAGDAPPPGPALSGRA